MPGTADSRRAPGGRTEEGPAGARLEERRVHPALLRSRPGGAFSAISLQDLTAAPARPRRMREKAMTEHVSVSRAQVIAAEL